MSETKDRTSFELEVGNVRIAVKGTEEYVDRIIKGIGDIFASVQEIAKVIPPVDTRGAPGGEAPPVAGPTTPTGDAEGWAKAISEKAEIPVEQVKRVFMSRNNQIVLYRWDVSDSGRSSQRQAELNRVVAILHMYANDVVTRGTYNLDTLKGAFREVRLSFTSRDRDLKHHLKRDNNIRELTTDVFELTPSGVDRAEELLKEFAQNAQ